MIGCSSTLTSEYWLIPNEAPESDPKVFATRERGLEYDIEHHKDQFYILTNKDDAFNFKIMKTDEVQTSLDNWVEFIPHNPEVLLEDIEIFENFYVLIERTKGLEKLVIHDWDETDVYELPVTSETYILGPMTNIEFETTKLRYFYNDMKTPYSILEYDMATKTTEVLKQQEVIGGYDTEKYESKRVWIDARDGTSVPVSMVYRKDTVIDQNTPLLLYAYGSYGATIDPYFSTSRLSLLDRGFVYAIAHIRGGEYLGRKWYENGKLLCKMNTFFDFVDVAEGLISLNYTSSDKLYAMGGSAGGLLMGVVVNIAPHLFHGVIASVPFVDVVTTMLDDEIPLTTGEYDEWGNPNEKKYYDYMKSYSPYDNVAAQAYPHMYVSTGLHDSQVQYWEPAKWVAKLRELKTDDCNLYLDTNMDAGHGGASGRFEGLKETAKEYAFLLDLEG